MKSLRPTPLELRIRSKIFGNSQHQLCMFQQEKALSFQLLFYQLVIVNYNNHKAKAQIIFYCLLFLLEIVLCFLFIHNLIMIDTQHYSLYRKYRAATKNDDDMFSVKYILADETKPSSKDQAQRIDRENKHGESIKSGAKEHEKKGFHPRRRDNKHEEEQEKHHNKFVQKYEKREKKHQVQEKQIPKPHYIQKSSPKVQTKAIVEPEELIKDETQELSELSPLKKSKDQYQLMEELAPNEDDDIVDELQELKLKNRRSKSSQFKEIFPEMELARKSQVQIYEARRLFDDYIDIESIKKSRGQGEHIYLKGIVQFADTVKWYCNILSSQTEGILVAEGRATNRACHEDEVYFKIIGEQKQKTKCAVVAILHKKVTQIVGKIEFSKTNQSYLLRPTNAKFASMKINLNEFKKQWLPDVYSKYFLAQFSSWQSTEDLPSCTIIEQYGFFGQVQIETKALLKTYGVEQRSYEKEDIERFLEPFKNNINENGQYIIPEEEVKKRRDFRKWRTFYVKDGGIDVTFSITPLNLRTKADPNFLKKNIYEINAHFADVSYFVRQNSALDQQIKKKGVSYNLIYKTLPLLPQPFSNTFCAFREGKDSITISISFQVDEDGNLLEGSKNTKSIITPQFFFTYEQLEKVIGENPVPTEEWKSWNCGCKGQPDYRSISADIKLIYKLISKRRENRIKSGALAFQIPVKCFKLASDFSAKSFQLKLKSKAMSMIEQCVISTSLKAAEFLFKNIKNKAILYRHKFPGFKKLLRFRQSLSKIGLKVPQNQSQILKFLSDLVSGTTIKQSHRQVIKYLTIKLLDNFDFFQPLSTDPTSWSHFVINAAMYTHIFAPRQSYGDLLVQRQLITAIEGQTWKLSDIETTQLLEGCNKAKLISQHIQNSCEKVFLCLYLRVNPVFTTGVVMSIEQWGIKICIPKFNFKNLIKFKSLASITVTKLSTDESSRKYVKIDYSKSTGQIKTRFVLKQMQQIDISIRSANSYPLDYVVSLALPHPTQPGEKIMID